MLGFCAIIVEREWLAEVVNWLDRAKVITLSVSRLVILATAQNSLATAQGKVQVCPVLGDLL